MLTDARDDVAPHDHAVQFYAREDELVAGAGRFLAAAHARGDAIVVIATPEHRDAFARDLAAKGIDVAAARTSGSLVEHDARATLASISRDGDVDTTRFNGLVDDVLALAGPNGRGVSVYGEMVALLWQAGQVTAALELETRWTDLLATAPLAVYCGYPTAALDPAAPAYRRLCRVHTHVVTEPASGRVSRLFQADARSVGAARRFVTATLRDWDCAVDDAALVVTELVTNAVLHARSAYVVTVERRPLGTRITVRDASRTSPVRRDASSSAATGRGLALVDALADAWGVQARGAHKAVWAEFRHR